MPTNQRGRKVPGGLDEAGQALWIEQEIERRLRIPDRLVGDEIPR